MSTQQGRGSEIQTELSRDIGIITALSIGVGTMIAAGIFTLSGLAIRNVGSSAVISFLLAATVATFTALTYCEFTSIYPESGEGYLYARKTFPPLFAFIVGWALLLGYSSSCAFYITSLSSYFNEFIWHPPYPLASGLIVLVGLTLLNIKGTKESGSFQVIITAVKVLLLIWFIAGGFSSVTVQKLTDKMSTDIIKIFSTAGLVFITFFGFSAIAASAGEIKNPTKTIPRAIFLSMGIVTVLYTLVVLVIIGANLSEYTEAAMGTAAKMFLGPIGGMVIVGGALFSMLSASNASIMAGSRVLLSMSTLGHMPHGVGAIDAKTRTPIVALVLIAGAIMFFAVSLPLEDLAHFADAVLLLALIFVNFALIHHRRKFPNIERPFRVPLVPILPGLGIGANLYLLVQIFLHHPAPAVIAFAVQFLGIIGFFAWRGLRVEEDVVPGEPSRVALEHSDLVESKFKILVPIANPDNVKSLITLAAAIAKKEEGEIIALRFVHIPEQITPSLSSEDLEREKALLDKAREYASQWEVPMTSLIKAGHNLSRSVLETARERNCDLIILGWKGYTSTARRILGEDVDNIVRHARRDIMLVKLTEDASFEKILLPTAGGHHARAAERHAAAIVSFNEKGSLTLCGIACKKKSEEVKEIEERLAQGKKRIEELDYDIDVDHELIEHSSVTKGIIEKAEEYDALMIGAAGLSSYSQVLFGSIPEEIAMKTNVPVIIFKHYQPVKALVGRMIND